MSRITAAKVTSASNQKDNFKTLQKKYELLSNKNTERCINTTVQTLRSIFFYSISNYQGFLINGQIKHIKNIKNILEENTSLSLTSNCGCAPPRIIAYNHRRPDTYSSFCIRTWYFIQILLPVPCVTWSSSVTTTLCSSLHLHRALRMFSTLIVDPDDTHRQTQTTQDHKIISWKTKQNKYIFTNINNNLEPETNIFVQFMTSYRMASRAHTHTQTFASSTNKEKSVGLFTGQSPSVSLHPQQRFCFWVLLKVLFFFLIPLSLRFLGRLRSSSRARTWGPTVAPCPACRSACAARGRPGPGLCSRWWHRSSDRNSAPSPGPSRSSPSAPLAVESNNASLGKHDWVLHKDITLRYRAAPLHTGYLWCFTLGGQQDS